MLWRWLIKKFVETASIVYLHVSFYYESKQDKKGLTDIRIIEKDPVNKISIKPVN